MTRIDLITSFLNFDVLYRFPDAEKIKNAIFKSVEIVAYGRHKLFPGIENAIADLAAKNFAKEEMPTGSIGIRSWKIIDNLRQGKDEFDQSELPKFRIAELEMHFLASYVASALFKCAKIIESESDKPEPVESKEPQKTKASEETTEGCERGTKKARVDS